MKIHSIKVDGENIFSPRALITELLNDTKSMQSLYTMPQKNLAFYQDNIVQEYARLIRRVIA